MELSQAKRFIYRDYDNEILYISRDFWKLMDMTDNIASDILAVCDTQVGEQAFEMDSNYSGEPFIYRRFMHMDSFMRFHSSYTVKTI